MSGNERRLISENEALKVAVEQLLARVADLEARLNQNSGNSSKPPSSDIGRKREPPVAPSGRKRGGQPGHEGKTRELAPPEEVDEVREVDPEACGRCGEPLEKAPRRDGTRSSASSASLLPSRL